MDNKPLTICQTRYYVTYRNQGKPEKTPPKYDNETDAYSCAAFLKIQGATSVRVHRLDDWVWAEERP